jgi:hypothetical protein
MAKRYSGSLQISVTYDDHNFYRTSVSHGGKLLWRGTVRPAPVGFGPGVAYDSPQAYDEIASSALAFADDEVGDIGDEADFKEDGTGYLIRRAPRPKGSSQHSTRKAGVVSTPHFRELQEKQRRLQSSLLAESPKKSHAQIKREIDEVLAKKPGSSSGDGPRILKISRGKSFADRRVFVVDVQYPGEEPMRVEFAGPSRDIVGPVVTVLKGQQTFVHDPSRFGTFGQDWIRRFYA